MDYDLIIIGAGSGGIATARRASLLGAKVLVIESGRMGGTCVNAGCVPKKVTSNLAQILYSISTRLCESYGIPSKPYSCNSAIVDFEEFVEKRNMHVKKLNNIFQKIIDDDPNIDLVKGKGELYDNYVMVNNIKYTFKYCVLATGSQPKHLFKKGTKENEKGFVKGTEFLKTSNDFFLLEKVPKKSVIIGSGYIGIELGFILKALGSEVHIIARKDKMLSSFDDILSNSIKEAMIQKGIIIHFNTNVMEIKKKGIILKTINNKEFNGFDVIELSNVDFMMCAIGRDCDLSFIKTEIENKNNYLIVDKNFKTSVKNVFAIGDLIGPSFMLTPIAIFCGRILAEELFGTKKIPENTTLIDHYKVYDCVPSVIFSHPPCGSIGISEKEAREMKGEIKIYTSTFKNTYYALLENDDEKEKSHFKIITLDNKVVGLHLFGTGVDEIVQGFAVAMKMGATFDDFKRTVAVHPTAGEEVVTMK